MKHTEGPWAWQLFGDCYMLTAQHGMREIIIGAIPHPEMKYPVPAMNNGHRLQEIDPDHPNAKLISSAPSLLKENEELKAERNECYALAVSRQTTILEFKKRAEKAESLNAELLEVLKKVQNLNVSAKGHIRQELLIEIDGMITKWLLISSSKS